MSMASIHLSSPSPSHHSVHQDISFPHNDRMCCRLSHHHMACYRPVSLHIRTLFYFHAFDFSRKGGKSESCLLPPHYQIYSPFAPVKINLIVGLIVFSPFHSILYIQPCFPTNTFHISFTIPCFLISDSCICCPLIFHLLGYLPSRASR